MADRTHQPSLPGADSEYVPCMSKENLVKFVDDFVSGRIFTSAHPAEGSSVSIGQVFMPLLFSRWSQTGLERIGILWEYMSQAAPWSINGMPCFMSMRIMNVDDWEIARAAILREQERRKTIEL